TLFRFPSSRRRQGRLVGARRPCPDYRLTSFPVMVVAQFESFLDTAGVSEARADRYLGHAGNDNHRPVPAPPPRPVGERRCSPRRLPPGGGCDRDRSASHWSARACFELESVTFARTRAEGIR